jgi:predicted metal-dependent phosphoesterase TrpH
MIDLHLHTNASDGRCSPRQLVARAVDARLSVISVVDHDTFAAQVEVARLASDAGLRAVPGIEITAVWKGLDVHVLAYCVDPARGDLERFLERQREDRLRRVNAMLDRLYALGLPVDFAQVVVPVGNRTPHAIGRPQVARALVRAGHATDTREAFDRYLADGQPAFVPRIGATPAEVVRLVVAAGGIASLAHPGLLGRDELIPDLVAAGMQAIEVYHPDHSPETVARYHAVAERYSLVPTGGSDYHAEETHGASLGHVTVPPADFERLETMARERRRHVVADRDEHRTHV